MILKCDDISKLFLCQKNLKLPQDEAKTKNSGLGLLAVSIRSFNVFKGEIEKIIRIAENSF